MPGDHRPSGGPDNLSAGGRQPVAYDGGSTIPGTNVPLPGGSSFPGKFKISE